MYSGTPLIQTLLGQKKRVLIWEVSLFQGLKSITMVLGEEESVLISEVSLFQGCPIEGFHCM